MTQGSAADGTATTVAGSDRPGLTTRYRAEYSKLPPALQLIGLQLWLPAMFVVAFCLCYVYAFHSPTPKNLPVAVVGTSTSVGQFASMLQTNSDGALQVSVSTSRTSAESAVRDGSLIAAYLPGAAGGSSTLIVASGAQYQLEATARATFAPVAAAQGTVLVVNDLAPLPAHDSYGTSLFYVTLVWTIGGYMIAMFVGMMGAALRHRTRAAIIVGGGLVVSVVSNVLVHYLVGAVEGHFWGFVLAGWATTVAIGSVVNGLAYFLGRYVTGAALLVFVFANIPASGGAFPPEFMPEPFAWLHHVVIGAGVMDILRWLTYGVGPGIGNGLSYLAAYLVIGLALSVVGKRYFAWRTARRAARGKPPSMMVVAQTAALAAGAAAVAQDVSSRPAPAGRHAADVGRTEGDAQPGSEVEEADVDAAVVSGTASAG